MLRNQWYPVLAARAVRRRPVGIRRFGVPLVLWRGPSGGVRAAVDACPHRGAALSRGRVRQGQLECPYHGLRFGPDGPCTHIPAHPEQRGLERWSLRTLPVCELRGLVWVWHGDAHPVSVPWDDAFEAELRQSPGPFLDLSDTFDVSYLRVMENLTDVHHVSAVHRSTIRAPSAITAFEARREGLDVYVDATLGERLTARIHLRAPFLGLLEFAGTARFAVAVCPIDRDHAWLFARYTQTAMRIWGLDWVLTWLLGQFDYRLLQRLEDAPVWRSQRLASPADVSAYQLFRADEGVRHYFDIHRELADGAA